MSKKLKLSRHGEDGILKAEGGPDESYFHRIAFGFQILDEPLTLQVPNKVNSTPDPESECFRGESAYTVLISPGQHLRSEILIIYSGVDGNMKMLQKGSISSEEDEDLRWIEKILNQHWEDQRLEAERERAASIRSKGSKGPKTQVDNLNQVPAEKWREMAALVETNPKAALQAILKALG
jgi:hypothetical protein